MNVADCKVGKGENWCENAALRITFRIITFTYILFTFAYFWIIPSDLRKAISVCSSAELFMFHCSMYDYGKYSPPTSPLPSATITQTQMQSPARQDSQDRHSATAKRHKYLRRLFKFRQMDFEYAFWQMLYLIVAPQKVYVVLAFISFYLTFSLLQVQKLCLQKTWV